MFPTGFQNSAIHLTGADRTVRLDLDALRGEVETWFRPEVLAGLMGREAEGATESIAWEWLARGGKRWRPFLTVCAWKAIQEDPRGSVAVSVLFGARAGLMPVALAWGIGVMISIYACGRTQQGQGGTTK
jgi:hypothetical protein